MLISGMVVLKEREETFSKGSFDFTSFSLQKNVGGIDTTLSAFLVPTFPVCLMFSNAWPENTK